MKNSIPEKTYQSANTDALSIPEPEGWGFPRRFGELTVLLLNHAN